jgi:hypothetical protein
LKPWILSLFLSILLFSCHKKAVNHAQPDIKTEIDKWKKQLLLNGEIGTPCDFDNQVDWAKQNPEVFYGLPDTVLSKEFDVNNDNINDVLLYFPAGDCCSCTMGLNEVSDFVKLIYSNETGVLENDNLGHRIESKIAGEFYSLTNTQVVKVSFSITDFNRKISGTYHLWTPDNPDCCPGVEGKFTYSPFTYEINITH